MAFFRMILRSRLERFWDLLDRESVTINQMLFYVLLSLHGFIALIGGGLGSQVMQLATSPAYYLFWLWLCFAGPLTCIVGKLCRGGFTYAGMWLQLVGDIGMWVTFVCYIGAISDTEAWNRGSFAATLAVCCAFGTPLFIARDIRRLRQVELAVRSDRETGGDSC